MKSLCFRTVDNCNVLTVLSDEILKILKVSNIFDDKKRICIFPTISEALYHAYERRRKQVSVLFLIHIGDTKRQPNIIFTLRDTSIAVII